MARVFPLAQQVDGINLMRSKGGASPNALFDLKNGWVTSQRTIKARGGSVKALAFPAGTKGCAAFEGKFHVFAHAAVAGAVPANVVVNILKHPSSTTATLTKVHRAFAFLGRLYVVAEFSDGLVRHYWIEAPAAWTTGTAYSFGAAVQPSVATGFYYEIKTASTVSAWQANTEVTVGAMKQPRVANGMKYTATAVTGTAPIRTSNTEPAWPTVAGATVVERRYVTQDQLVPGTETPEGGTSGGGAGGGGGAGSEYGPFPPDGAPRQAI